MFLTFDLHGLQLLINQLEPLTEQQLLAINNLQQSSQQAEDALSQGMEALQQSLAETLAGSLGPSGSSGNVANYMGQMAMAMGKLGTLEGFIRQVITLVFYYFFRVKKFGLFICHINCHKCIDILLLNPYQLSLVPLPSFRVNPFMSGYGLQYQKVLFRLKYRDEQQ